jgi:D-amino-acid dehydrogenase
MSKRVLIIGGGVIGLSCAYYAVQRGYKVTVIDRNPKERNGCSFGNAGMIVPSHFVPLAAPGMVALGLKWMWNPESPFYIRPRLNLELFSWAFRFWRAANANQVAKAAPLLRDLSFASRNCFEELADANSGLGDFGLVKRGLLMLCQTAHTLEEEAHFAEVLDAKQTAALDPGITMNVAGSVFFPKDAHLAPNRFMSELQAGCDRLGVNFRWNSEVAGIRLGRGRLEAVNVKPAAQGSATTVPAQASPLEIEADEFVLAGGAWSPSFANELGLNLPMQAGKGYSLTLNKPPQLPQLCSILTEARVAVTPMGTSLRIGGTMELDGLNEEINPRRVSGIIRSAQRYFPKFSEADFQGIAPWRGLRPCSPDGLPYLGRPERYSNVTLATGHAMMGLSLGPITGLIVARILAQEPTGFDLSLLKPDRFS